MNTIKKCFEKLQYKFFIIIISISLVPFIILTVFAVNIYAKKLIHQVESNAVLQLRSVDETIFEKVKNIQRFVDIIKLNPAVSKEFAQMVPDHYSFEAAMKSSVASCEGIEGVLFLMPTGENYSYNLNSSVIDIVRLQVLYNSIDSRPNTLTWFDTKMKNSKVGINSNLMLVGTTYEYTDFSGEIRSAKVYIFADKALFGDVLQKFSDTFVCITDKNGAVITCNDDNMYNSLIKENLDMMNRVYTIDEGVFEEENTDTYNISVYTSNSTGFKYISISDLKKFYSDVNIITKTALLIILILLIIFALLYLFVIKKITMPIRKISEIMKNFDDTTLGIRIPIESHDEIGDIADGFNKMMDCIADMIEEIKTGKDNQRDAEIKALSYQINPHFLYNALSAIRFEAINNSDGKVAESLLCLSRLLKSVFSNTNKYLSLQEEFEISENTVKLLALRYNNSISYKTCFEDKYGSFKIPSMILQPIIENCVLHGLSPKMHDNFQAKIDVFASEEDGDLIVRVTDNGVGMDDEKIKNILNGSFIGKKSIGIYNVDERIKLLYGEDYGVSINSKQYIYTEVVLRLKIIE